MDKEQLYEMGKKAAMKRQPKHFPEFARQEEEEKFSHLPQLTQDALKRRNHIKGADTK